MDVRAMNAKRLAAALSTSHREKDLTNAKVRDIRQKALNFLADVRVPLGRTVIRSDAVLSGSLTFLAFRSPAGYF